MANGDDNAVAVGPLLSLVEAAASGRARRCCCSGGGGNTADAAARGALVVAPALPTRGCGVLNRIVLCMSTCIYDATLDAIGATKGGLSGS